MCLKEGIEIYFRDFVGENLRHLKSCSQIIVILFILISLWSVVLHCVAFALMLVAVQHDTRTIDSDSILTFFCVGFLHQKIF